MVVVEEMPPPRDTFRVPEPKTDRELLLQICDAISKVQEDIGEIREQGLVDLATTAKSNAQRISHLENWQKWLTGAMGVSVVAALAATGWLNNQIGWVRDLVISHISSTGGRMP